MRELALHILDLVQNAVEAGAGQVTLTIEEDSVSDWLTITVADNGRGMDEEQCRRVIDPFVTSRTTRRIGLGLPLIDMSTRQCKGSLAIVSTVGQGTTVTAKYRYGHIDRPPLGNMAETLKALLIANIDRDFCYVHRVDGREFTLAAADIAASLDGLSVTQPEVLTWLDGFLKENFAILYGGVDNENS